MSIIIFVFIIIIIIITIIIIPVTAVHIIMQNEDEENVKNTLFNFGNIQNQYIGDYFNGEKYSNYGYMLLCSDG